MDKDDKYIKQLEDIFNSFCDEGKCEINKEQLCQLCERLSLDNECTDRVLDLAFSENYVKGSNQQYVNFSHFCDCFVTTLSEITDCASVEDLSDTSEKVDHVQSEVEPRLVRGGRRYGRKSIPDELASETNNDVDYNDNTKIALNNHWQSVDTIASSDEGDDRVNDKVYYESVFPSTSPQTTNYFEANGIQETCTIHKIPSPEKKISIVETSASSVYCDATNVNLFSALELEDVGAIEEEQLLEMWKRGGVSNPSLVLNALDVERTGDQGLIDSYQLSTTLEKEVISLIPTLSPADAVDIHESLACALLTSYKHQLCFMNSQVDHYRQLTGKMKDDLEKSEIRNSKIIEEVDDHYLSVDQQNERLLSGMERRWSKKVNSLQREFERERGTIINQANYEREELKAEIEQLQLSELALQRKVAALKSENDDLSRESVQLYEKLNDAEKDSQRLRKDLECLLAAKTGDTSDPINTSQEEKFAMIIKEYEAQCRQLSDRNDELAMEVKEVRSKLRQQEAHEMYSNQNLYDEEKMISPKRKRVSRRRDASLDYMDRSISDTEDSQSLDERCGDAERFLRKSSPDKSMTSNFAAARIAELERLVEELRSEKRRSAEDFALEKAKYKADLEKEFQLKLEAETSRMHCYDNNKAAEEQNTMTMQLLKSMTQQKDELDVKVGELEERLRKESSSGQQGIADLCREFANEKSELLSTHQEKARGLEERLESLTQTLEDEKKANERFAEQLKIERVQHKEALSAHQEIINKFERSAAVKEQDGGMLSTEKLRELTRKHECEVTQLKRDHSDELKSVKREMESKLDELLSEKQQGQDSLSVCSELERLQESIGVERKEMHERMQEMREAFEREATELRHLLDSDKVKLRKQLSEEVALIRQRMAEETEKEMKKKRQIIEEEEKRLKEKENIQLREAEALKELREEVNNLQERNKDLESLLSKANKSLEEQAEQIRRAEEANRKAEAERLERKIEEAKKKMRTAEQKNIQLRLQVENLVDEGKAKEVSLASMQTKSDMKTAEKHRLRMENEDLLEKIQKLEKANLSIRLENASLSAKCEHLERIEVVKPVPIPVPRKNTKKKEKEDGLEDKKEMKEKVELLKKEVSGLRGQLANQCHETIHQSTNDDVVSESESVKSSSEKAMESLQGRLHKTRTQFTDQLKKTKDLYSKLAKTELLVKDLYCENAHLMRALQVTESRQKDAERKLSDEKDKNRALGQLLQQACPEVT